MENQSKILLVDDEPSLVKLVGKRLESEGFNVLVSTDGYDALNKARNEDPNLIILDLMLPKMDGFQICSILKRDDRYRRIPIILFTAKVQEEDEKMGFQCGADAYVRKPFKSAELLQQVRSLLSKAN